FIFLVWLVPAFNGFSGKAPAIPGTGTAGLPMHDVVVNINEDDAASKTMSALLSERDSSGRGHLTKQKGDTFLNNSQIFSATRGGASGMSGHGSGSSQTTSSATTTAQLPGLKPSNASSADADEYPISIELIHDNPLLAPVGGSAAVESEWTKIPDVKGINSKNAMFISNDGSFSFNTRKFKDFEYFKSMKNRIGNNWYPPTLGHAYLPTNANSRTGVYTPGYTRTSLIPSQEVVLYFVMDRTGEVVDIKVLQSLGKSALVDSCIDAIRNSKNFGKVPADITGPLVVIPFVFGYYVDE
ncbi:MAG TPA: energy transducer TonB, partial [Spirochaetota bacterium]